MASPKKFQRFRHRVATYSHSWTTPPEVFLGPGGKGGPNPPTTTHPVGGGDSGGPTLGSKFFSSGVSKQFVCPSLRLRPRSGTKLSCLCFAVPCGALKHLRVAIPQADKDLAGVCSESEFPFRGQGWRTVVEALDIIHWAPTSEVSNFW